MSKKTRTEKKEDELFPLPEYAPKDDIYKQEEESEIDPETRKKKSKDDEDPLDGDLDIPGDELDDEDEAIGEEDEENNYYSLGGDNHDDLEEDNG